MCEPPERMGGYGNMATPGKNGRLWQYGNPRKEWAVMKEIVIVRGSQIGVLCYIIPMPGGRLH